MGISKQIPVESFSPQQSTSSLRASWNLWRSSNYKNMTCLGKVWQVEKFYSATSWVTFSLLLQVGLTTFGNPSAQIYHTMQSIQHHVWQKLDGKCNPLLPPCQFKEVFLRVHFFLPRNTLIMPELRKDGFYVVLSPKHSIVMGLFICVFTVTWCSPVIEIIMERVGMCFPQD